VAAFHFETDVDHVIAVLQYYNTIPSHACVEKSLEAYDSLQADDWNSKRTRDEWKEFLQDRELRVLDLCGVNSGRMGSSSCGLVNARSLDVHAMPTKPSPERQP
jgi:hypothetical protein